MAGDINELGRRFARRVQPHGEQLRPSDLAAQMKVRIERRTLPPPAQPHLRSEYSPAPPTITLYCDAISAVGAALHAQQRFDLLRSDLEEIHIAHELFHHLEFVENAGPLTEEEVEQAAHAFVRALLALDFDPVELSGFGG